MITALRIFLVLLIAAPAYAGDERPAGNGKLIVLNPARIMLNVAADGRASNLNCAAGVAPEICGMLLRAVPTWKFAPGQRDGVAREMDVALTVTLVAKPESGGFAVQATSAELDPTASPTGSTQAAESRRKNPPIYPPDLMRRGFAGTVILELWPQPSGAAVRIGKTWFQGKPAGRKNGLVAAAMDSSVKWKLDPLPPEQLSFCLAVEYSFTDPHQALKGTAPCEATYVSGYTPPKLLTDVTTAKL